MHSAAVKASDSEGEEGEEEKEVEEADEEGGGKGGSSSLENGDSNSGGESERKAGTVEVSTRVGTAVDGRIVHRRRPGIIIEEYRDGDGDGSGGGGDGDSSSSKAKKAGKGGGGKDGDDDGMEEEGEEEEEEEEEEGGGENGEEGAEVNSAGFNPEKLRVYELRKLKYYFAVLECSSTTAAEAIYRQDISSSSGLWLGLRLGVGFGLQSGLVPELSQR